MAFKLRLQIFFIILTVVPLLVGGWMIQRTVIESKKSSIDKSLAAGVGTLGAQYAAVFTSGQRVLADLPNNLDLQQAILNDDSATVSKLADDASSDGLVVTVADGSGKLLTSPKPLGAREVGPQQPITSGPDTLATVRVYVDTRTLITKAQQPGDKDVTLGLAAGRAAGKWLQLADSQVRLPRGLALGRPFGMQLQGARYRSVAGAVSSSAAVALYPQHLLGSYTSSIRLRIALFMGFLLILIGVGAALAVRALTHTLRTFSDGMGAVAEGRFDQRLPVRGNDEFSQFGAVFNDMSSQLEQRIDELDSERRRVQEFGQRFGAALAATHDVAGLLEIVVDSAVQLARADGARLLVADEGTDVLVEQLRRGDLGAAARLLDAPVRYGEGIEGRALQTRQAVIGDEPAPLLAAPLVAEERVLGLLTLVGNPDRPFGRDDAERVGSLVGQGAVAIENARLHRLIQKQAKTDPLTQLLNRREFEEQLAREVERAQRFGTPVGLVVLDLDDFKLINDRFGHLAGDGVLKAAAGAIRQCTREIDQPARWGGEEFAVILPHTGLDGAARLAERLRQAIAERQIDTPDGRSVRVTASFGVAALPGSGSTQVELTAAADDAVYRSKRAGKNRVSLADAQEGDELSVPGSYQ
jgi:diguanylate cyclase (GGDEF)-like protein